MLSFIGMLCRVCGCAVRGKDGQEPPAEKPTKEQAVAPPAQQAPSGSGDSGQRS